MSGSIQHEAILASAGSGKTFALAHRYIRLLAAGVEPARIIAITFSRKAAGEIFVSIVKYLRQAAADDLKASGTAERIDCPHFQRADFLELLRRFVDQLHRLHISTIDSFTVSILRMFPMELGISPAFDLMDNGSVTAARARADALGRFFEDMNRDDPGRNELMESFKLATFGREEKTFARDFDQFIEEFQTCYKLLPMAAAWGSPERIWPEGNDWLASEGPNLAEVLDALREQVADNEWDDYALGKWAEFIDALPAYLAGGAFDSVKYLGERLLAAADEIRRGEAEVKFRRRTYACDPKLNEALHQVVDGMMRSRLQLSMERTRGLFKLLHQFEHMYDTRVRRVGQLTFDDAQYVIQRGGLPLSRDAAEQNRLYIDFRLDSGLDHWLIDEFQDTSDLQWEVFRNLADEVLQDAEGRRSFFFVGDVKQAIYGWRGGNHKLFGQILAQYGERIERQGLNVSYRSTQPILEVVNRVCEQLPDRIDELVGDAWQPFWDTHRSAGHICDVPGYTALIEARGESDDEKLNRYHACGHVIRQLDPLRRGLSVGVLVRRNNIATAVGDVIRALCPDIPVAVEGQSTIGDNPVVRVLLSLIRYAAHPGHSLARLHVQMSPLRTLLDSERLTPAKILRSLFREGYQTSIRSWGQELSEVVELDAFGMHRLQQLIEAAGDFDAGGQRDPDEFLAFIEGYSVPEQSSEVGVRVMTVHKSKGLGFDAVVLPDLPDGTSIDSARRDPLHIARDEEGQPDWALLMPDRAICEADSVLAEELKQARRDDCFENLCALYVALTRAKRGLYMITSPPPKKSESLNWSGMLRLQLAGDIVAPAGEDIELDSATHGLIYQDGEPDWYLDCHREEATADQKPAHISRRFVAATSLRRRLLRVSPSSRAEKPRPAHTFFMPTVNRSLDLGTAVHGLFEQVDWLGDMDLQAAITIWRQESGTMDEEAEHHFLRACGQPEFVDALRRPEGQVTLWRERSFEAVLEKEWVTGMFDRVVVIRDDKGKVVDAVIQDFKTNDVESDDAALQAAAEPYRAQLQLYAKALSKLIRFPEERIRTQLLFTRPGRVVEV